MKSRLYATACALALMSATASVEVHARQADRGAQRGGGRANQGGMQFDDHARQTTKDWYSQHQSSPPVGFRSKDRLTSDQESRLQPGKALDPDLRQRTHPLPRDLSRQLPSPPANHRYVAVGGHVGLVDNVSHVLRDIIHVHN